MTGIRPFLLLPAALLTLLLAYLFFPGRRNRRSYRRAFLCGTLIGCAAFFVSFGWKVLDPERTAWLLGGGDPDPALSRLGRPSGTRPGISRPD